MTTTFEERVTGLISKELDGLEIVGVDLLHFVAVGCKHQDFTISDFQAGPMPDIGYLDAVLVIVATRIVAVSKGSFESPKANLARISIETTTGK